MEDSRPDGTSAERRPIGGGTSLASAFFCVEDSGASRCVNPDPPGTAHPRSVPPGGAWASCRWSPPGLRPRAHALNKCPGPPRCGLDGDGSRSVVVECGVPVFHGVALSPWRSSRKRWSAPEASPPAEPPHPSLIAPGINMPIRSHLQQDAASLLLFLRVARGSPILSPASHANPPCPRCGAGAPYRWGTFSGRQRFRCRTCRRTFSDLTGSPFQHARDLASWRQFLECLAHGCSLRATSFHCGISLTTAFRRRHRILSWRMRFEETAPSLRGCVGLHELRIPESFKGSKSLPRPPRTHAPPWRERTRGDRTALVLVLVRDQTASPVLLPNRSRARLVGVVGRPPHAGTLRACLAQNLNRGACLHPAVSPTWRGWPSPGVFTTNDVKTKGCRCPRSMRGRSNPVSDIAPRMREGVVKYRNRLRRWLPRFRGVATRYLPHYLVWFEAWAAVFPDDGDLERWSAGGPDRHSHERNSGTGSSADLCMGAGGERMLVQFLI